MNCEQHLWWRQASSDHEVLELLRRHGAAPCHQLHYLQMVTEKLGKAYFWRSGHPPPRRHASIVRFLRALGAARQAERKSIAGAFGFKRFNGFQQWVHQNLTLAYSLERLAPDLADTGPNPEYPWPHDIPQHVPADFDFALWNQLNGTGQGRKFLQMVQCAIIQFPIYA